MTTIHIHICWTSAELSDKVKFDRFLFICTHVGSDSPHIMPLNIFSTTIYSIHCTIQCCVLYDCTSGLLYM